MGAYSKDLRIKALAATNQGTPRSEVLETFGISLATLKRWLKKRREGEDLSPRSSTERRRRILTTPEEKHAVGAARRERRGYPGAPLRDLGTGAEREGFGSDDESGDPPQARVDPKKRSLGASERDEAARSTWRERLRALGPSRLVLSSPERYYRAGGRRTEGPEPAKYLLAELGFRPRTYPY
jgi:hypothetical protein